jgi:hypothetical protein
MRGNVASRAGIIAGLIGALVMLVSAYAEKHLGAHAAPVQHTISAPVTRVSLRASPVTIDIDLANARVSLDVSL